MRQRIVTAATYAWLALYSLTATADAVLAAAEQALLAQRPADAYAALAPLQMDRAGDPRFDYLLGMAALDSGRPGEAILAFERVLTVDPAHAQARAELARAYFVLGDHAGARREFAAVKDQNPPAAVQATVQKYLDAMAAPAPRVSRSARAYIEVGVGHDSNINSATADSQIAVPILGGLLFTLDEASRGHADNFATYAFGGSLLEPFGERHALFAGASIEEMENDEFEEYEIGQLSGYVGWRYRRLRHNYSIALNGQRYDVAETPYRDSLGGTLQWQYVANRNHLVTATLGHVDLRYPDQEMLDATQTIASLTLLRAVNDRGSAVFAGLYGGEETADNDRLSYDLYGVRIGGQYQYAPKTALFAAATVQQSDYQSEFVIFAATRADTRADVNLGIEWALGKRLRLKPQVQYTRNQSNIVLFDFERTRAWLVLRRDFGTAGGE